MEDDDGKSPTESEEVMPGGCKDNGESRADVLVIERY